MASLAYQKMVATFYYGILGVKSNIYEIDRVGAQMERGELSTTGLARKLLDSETGQEMYGGYSNSAVITAIGYSIFGRSPDNMPSFNELYSLPLDEALATLMSYINKYKTGGDKTGTYYPAKAKIDKVVNEILYPTVNQATDAHGAQDVFSLYYVIGSVAVADGIGYWGNMLNSGKMTLEQVAQKFIYDRAYLTVLDNTQFIERLFLQGFKREANQSEMNKYLHELEHGSRRGDVLVEIIKSLRDPVTPADQAAKDKFIANTTVFHKQGELPALNYQEQVSALYLAIPHRNIDSGGLDNWSKYLEKGRSYKELAELLLGSAEFMRKGAQLNGNEFIQHVFKELHGRNATASELSHYAGLGAKSDIAVAIIFDLRNNTATDNESSIAQHAFERDIGTSLMYETALKLGKNNTGTANSGVKHTLSNAEIAVLTSVTIDPNEFDGSTNDLSFADHLKYLTINDVGPYDITAGTVKLSTNGVSKGVTIDSGMSALNFYGSNSGDYFNDYALHYFGVANYKFGAGDDVLYWNGNAHSMRATFNSIKGSVYFDGGAGNNIISANYIEKVITVYYNGISRHTEISSHAEFYKNFQQIELDGYIGGFLYRSQYEPGGQIYNESQLTEIFGGVLDMGVLTGNATLDFIDAPGVVTQAAKNTTLGEKGFVFGSRAAYYTLKTGVLPKEIPVDAYVSDIGVRIINIQSSKMAHLEVQGNGDRDTTTFSFMPDVTEKFDIKFNASSSGLVDAGYIGVKSQQSDGPSGVGLKTINIESSGYGEFANKLGLHDTSSRIDITDRYFPGKLQVETVNITGDHKMLLTLKEGYKTVHTIDATNNSAGVKIDSSATGGTGNGAVVNLLHSLSLTGSDLVLWDSVLGGLGLNGEQLNIKGSQADDLFLLTNNTTVTGGGGRDTFQIQSSVATAGITLKDFQAQQDVILDTTLDGYTSSKVTLVSNNNSNTQVADYGVGNDTSVVSQLAGMAGNVPGDALSLLKALLHLDTGLSSKVGIASIEHGNGKSDSFLIIDRNNNQQLDNNDGVVLLKDQVHNDLINSLFFKTDVNVTGRIQDTHYDELFS
ncbi:DUF4214 domain-containing protein [Serratia plymuthica]|uniref:DUF4214 domain-containing protein n=1 Tax=Serratia plymuthica TaxID=82996 RepID=UPI003DA307BD